MLLHFIVFSPFYFLSTFVCLSYTTSILCTLHFSFIHFFSPLFSPFPIPILCSLPSSVTCSTTPLLDAALRELNIGIKDTLNYAQGMYLRPSSLHACQSAEKTRSVEKTRGVCQIQLMLRGNLIMLMPIIFKDLKTRSLVFNEVHTVHG